MESLSEVLKYVPQQTLRMNPDEAFQQLMAHPAVQNFIHKNGPFEPTELRMSMNRLYQFKKEYDHCSACPGLDQCPNDFEGHYTKLSVQSVHGQKVIVDQKVACKKMRSKQSQDLIKQRIRSFYVDEKALQTGYSSKEIYQRDMERSESVERLLEYIVTTKKNGLQPKGLYLAGSFGTGKTFLMCYMLHELAKDGLSGVIIYMPDFVEDLKAMIHEPGKLKETIELLKSTDLLVFDDMGAENLNPWVRDHVLGTILNYRMNRKPTFFTSNYDLDAMEKHLSFTDKEGDNDSKGRRLMERIRYYVEVISVNGKNQREHK
ncbi:primosomal protein DnaI [Marinicrinis lubricantis]|uniref:Primosomal protein DnaI n=1 Tax=Marinicrinis lubricantis TaxID=2086470 RepID=A0ABW1IUN2_9BACL